MPKFPYQKGSCDGKVGAAQKCRLALSCRNKEFSYFHPQSCSLIFLKKKIKDKTQQNTKIIVTSEPEPFLCIAACNEFACSAEGSSMYLRIPGEFQTLDTLHRNNTQEAIFS